MKLKNSKKKIKEKEFEDDIENEISNSKKKASKISFGKGSYKDLKKTKIDTEHRIPILLTVLVLLIALCIISINFLTKDHTKKPSSSSSIDETIIENMTIEKQWILDTWLIDRKNDPFTFAFRYNFVRYYYNIPSDQDIGEILVLSFYGDDSSKFAFDYYRYGEAGTSDFGTGLSLQFLTEKDTKKVEEWRKTASPIASEKLEGMDKSFQYYIVNSRSFDFVGNYWADTDISFNPLNCEFKEDKKETSFKYLTKSSYINNYTSDYGYPVDMLEKKDVKIPNDKKDLAKTYNMREWIYVISQDDYSKYSSMKSDEKKEFITNKIINGKTSDYAKIQVTDNYTFMFCGFECSFDPDGTNIKYNINDILEQNGWCTIDQGKELSAQVFLIRDNITDIFS